MHKLHSLLFMMLTVSFTAGHAQVDEAAQPLEPPVIEEPAPIPPPIDEVDPLGDGAMDAEIPGAALPAEGELVPEGPVQAQDATLVQEMDDMDGPVSSRPRSDFQGDDVATVLRLLARQARANLVVSDRVAQSQMTVTMRLEDKSPMEIINIIVRSKGLVMDVVDGVYYVKTPEEKDAEPTESAFYVFSYAQAPDVAALLQAQLGGATVQVDPRTNAIFYRVAQSQKDQIAMFLETIDRPTRQVMIEARLVEVTANPRQNYGINWQGILGGRNLTLGGSTPTTVEVDDQGMVRIDEPAAVVMEEDGTLIPQDFLFDPDQLVRGALSSIGGQFAILSTNQLSLTLNLINQDDDAEFLANPRVVTADNQEATIRIVRNQPVPQLNFNEQTATAVFGGFEDKEFGNQLVVKPTINKDDFITLSVKPEISNKVGDATFTFAGATVASPVIDTRSLESNVLIKSGNTLAIGGLLQDEVLKGRTKVPVLGDIPVFGYLFQNRSNARTKRNLLVFVTPTIIQEGYGTGLEDQVDGLHHVGEEFADPNGWRNNARGAIRLVPTSNRQNVADYPAPGTPLPPERMGVDYRADAVSREK